jgi:hypothetical protein
MPAAAARITVEISAGELVDKVTILEIKAERIRAADQRRNVLVQLEILNGALSPLLLQHAALGELKSQLRAINEALWQIEDDIRAREQLGDFGTEFIALARAVYRTNDQRSAIKRAIDDLTGSPIVEEKSYTAY